MTTVALLKVLVRDSATSIIPVSVPEYEAEVVKSIFGEENVNEYEDRGSIEVDHDVEYDRLCNKYGVEVVKDIYRSSSNLVSVILDSAQKEQKKAKKTTSTEEV